MLLVCWCLDGNTVLWQGITLCTILHRGKLSMVILHEGGRPGFVMRWRDGPLQAIPAITFELFHRNGHWVGVGRRGYIGAGERLELDCLERGLPLLHDKRGKPGNTTVICAYRTVCGQ